MTPNPSRGPQVNRQCRHQSCLKLLVYPWCYWCMAISCFWLSLTLPVRPSTPSYTSFTFSHSQITYSYSVLVCPVFYFTAVSLGGYGFSPLQISLFMALAGISQALWILLVFPPLQGRFGTGGVLRGCAVAWPILFFVAPLGNFFLRQDWKLTFWIVGPMFLVVGSGVSMAFSKLCTIEFCSLAKGQLINDVS